MASGRSGRRPEVTRRAAAIRPGRGTELATFPTGDARRPAAKERTQTAHNGNREQNFRGRHSPLAPPSSRPLCARRCATPVFTNSRKTRGRVNVIVHSGLVDIAAVSAPGGYTPPQPRPRSGPIGRMRTSVPDVGAAGDCVEPYHRLLLATRICRWAPRPTNRAALPAKTHRR